MQAKHERWVLELIQSGRFVRKYGPSKDKFQERAAAAAGLQVYATNGLGETYRVVGWAALDAPILAGQNGDFVGLFNYVFTAGPR